ncbi:MAG: DUF1801 domain-containing protein [Phycisphaerales bacterium]|nr:DUF1801 domain-containing protein [Phycisphaerales bacterium]
MQSKAKTVLEYLKSLPEDRRKAIEAVRQVIKKNLGKGFVEAMQYGMIGYVVPHSVYPAGYHCDPSQPVPFAALASQKNYMSVYLNAMYGGVVSEDWVRARFEAAGKKLDMGKCCIRFKKLEDLPLDVIGDAIRSVSVAQYIEQYEETVGRSGSGGAKKATSKPSSAKPTKKQASKKKVSSKKVATKKKVAKKSGSRAVTASSGKKTARKR